MNPSIHCRYAPVHVTLSAVVPSRVSPDPGRSIEHIRLAAYGLSQFARDIVRTLVSDLRFVHFVELPEPSGDLPRDFANSGAVEEVMQVTLHLELERHLRSLQGHGAS